MICKICKSEIKRGHGAYFNGEHPLCRSCYCHRKNGTSPQEIQVMLDNRKEQMEMEMKYAFEIINKAKPI